MRERRSQLNFSQKEAAMATLVQVKYIEALEQGAFSDLPADVYVRGFLTSLAKIYGINRDDILEQYRVEKQINENIDGSRAQKKDSPGLVSRFVISPKTIAIMATGLVGLMSLGYLATQFRSISAPPELLILAPAENGTVNSGLLQISGETEQGAEVMINNQPIVVDAQGKFLENISLARGSNQIVFTARNKFDQETTVTRTVVFEEKTIAGAYQAAGAEEDKGLALEIAIGGEEAWLSVAADGEDVFAGVMKAGSTRKINAKERIVLTTGNAGATRVFLNNRDLGFLGEEGEVRRDIEFTD